MAGALPPGWGSGTLSSGQPYWFHLAVPADIQFEPPAATVVGGSELQVERRAIALHAWNTDAGADGNSDLIFTKGAEIVVVSDQPGQGWLTGRLVGDATTTLGIFPANFCRLLPQDGATAGTAGIATAATMHGEAGDKGSDTEQRARSPDRGETTTRSRSPDPGGASKRRARSPDPGDVIDGQLPPPGGTASADSGVPRDAADDDPIKLQKKSGAFVYDEATQTWKMNEELAKKKQEREDEYTFFRALFRQCANEVARKQRAYDKGITSRFRAMSALRCERPQLFRSTQSLRCWL
jgi:hypothetical protein